MALVTGIDPGTYSIKVVQGQAVGPLFKLTRATTIPIDPDGDSESEILQTIQSSLPGLRLKPAPARLGITGRDLMIRYTSVPPVPLWRLRMLMDFEIQDMSQASGDPLTADYNIVENGAEDGDETVLVSLVKSHFLEGRIRALSGARAEFRSATPNCISLFNAFMAFGEFEEGEYTFLLDVGDQNLEMAIQKDGELIFARNLSGGGILFTRAIRESWDVGVEKARELKHTYGNVTPRGRASYSSSQEEKVANAIMGVAGQLASMVQSTMNFARTQSGIRDMQIGRLVISGGGSALAGLDAYLEQNMSIPVRRFEPDAGLDLSALPPDELEEFSADPSSFVCALGLARMSQDDEAFLIDLVPAAIKAKRRFMQRALYMILAGVAAVGFLCVLWFDLSSKVTASEREKETAKRNERKVVHVRQKYEETVEAANRVKDKLDLLGWESRPATYLVRGQRLVQENAPASVWIRAVEVSRRPVVPAQAEGDRTAAVEKVIVTVKGEIRQLGEHVTTTFNKFVESLRADPLAPVVETLQRPPDSGGDFELSLDFAGWPKAAAIEEDES